MSHPQNRWLTLGTSLVIIVLLGAACDSGDDGAAGGAGADADPTTTAPETTTTTLPETTTTAAPTPEEEVLAAYAGYWAAVDDVFGPPVVTPDLPALPMHATGEVLEGVITNAERTRDRNEVYRVPEDGLYSHQATVLSIEESTAIVRDCNVDDTVVIDTVSGDVLDDAVVTKLYIAMLVEEEGQWKVASLTKESEADGVAGCALEG